MNSLFLILISVFLYNTILLQFLAASLCHNGVPTTQTSCLQKDSGATNPSFPITSCAIVYTRVCVGGLMCVCLFPFSRIIHELFLSLQVHPSIKILQGPVSHAGLTPAPLPHSSTPGEDRSVAMNPLFTIKGQGLSSCILCVHGVISPEVNSELVKLNFN